MQAPSWAIEPYHNNLGNGLNSLGILWGHCVNNLNRWNPFLATGGFTWGQQMSTWGFVSLITWSLLSLLALTIFSYLSIIILWDLREAFVKEIPFRNEYPMSLFLCRLSSASQVPIFVFLHRGRENSRDFFSQTHRHTHKHMLCPDHDPQRESTKTQNRPDCLKCKVNFLIRLARNFYTAKREGSKVERSSNFLCGVSFYVELQKSLLKLLWHGWKVFFSVPSCCVS